MTVWAKDVPSRLSKIGFSSGTGVSIKCWSRICPSNPAIFSEMVVSNPSRILKVMIRAAIPIPNPAIASIPASVEKLPFWGERR